MNNFKPTCLYIKRHDKTGMMYLGKTNKPDPYKYAGSGKRWQNHYKKHGKEYIKTVWVSERFTDIEALIEFSLFISEELDIVKSENFANIIPENGINGGGDCSQMHTEEIRTKAKNTLFKNYGTYIVGESDIIRNKQKYTISVRYGGVGNIFNNASSINKRNNTNLILYGNKCAANRNGNINSKITQKNLLNRDIVLKIKLLSGIMGVTLHRGWYYSTDNVLNEFYTKNSNIEIPQINTSKFSNLKLKDYSLRTREAAILLRLLNMIICLKLGRNWHTKSDDELSNILNNAKLKYPKEFDIVLQTYYQYYLITL